MTPCDTEELAGRMASWIAGHRDTYQQLAMPFAEALMFALQYVSPEGREIIWNDYLPNRDY